MMAMPMTDPSQQYVYPPQVLNRVNQLGANPNGVYSVGSSRFGSGGFNNGSFGQQQFNPAYGSIGGGMMGGIPGVNMPAMGPVFGGATQGIPQAPQLPRQVPQLQNSPWLQALMSQGMMPSGAPGSMMPIQGMMQNATLSPLMQPNFGVPQVGTQGPNAGMPMGPGSMGGGKGGGMASPGMSGGGTPGDTGPGGGGMPFLRTTQPISAGARSLA